MSNSSYERNNTMVACVLGVLIVGAISVGAIAYFGNTWIGFFPNHGEQVYFSYDRNVGSVSGLVTLDVDLSIGSVNVEFDDNATLLYNIDFEMNNQSYQQYGEPTVTFSATTNTITLSHEVGSANITLGSGLNYALEVTTSTGSQVVVLGADAHVRGIRLNAGTGSLSLTLINDATIVASPTFDLETSTGSITVVAVLPDNIDGDFEGAVGTGSVSITAPTWNMITSNHYRTDDYATASQTIDIVAQTSTGSINAVLS
ncbi:MAG: hypothetical protein RTU30_06410 [Candidatus Thorarchaeota archaeon]